MASSSGAVSGVPYLVRTGHALIAASDKVALMLDSRKYTPNTVDVLRDLALTLAVLDGEFCDFLTKLLGSANVHVADSTPLPELLEQLNSLSTHARWRRLPAGGVVSIVYHLLSSLEDLIVALDRLRRGSLWDSGGSASFPVAAALVFTLLRFSRLRHLRLRRLSAFALGIAALAVYNALNYAFGRQARLQRLHAQLNIVVRLWIVAIETFHAANRQRRNASYSGLVSDRGDQDYDASGRTKTVARRLLERSSLPRGAAVWGGKGGHFGFLKHVLDMLYASLEVGYLAKSRGWPLPVELFLYAAGAAYYTIFPFAAADRTASIMSHPDVLYIKHVWCLLDGNLPRFIALKLAMPRLALCLSTRIAGCDAHVLSGSPLSGWDANAWAAAGEDCGSHQPSPLDALRACDGRNISFPPPVRTASMIFAPLPPEADRLDVSADILLPVDAGASRKGLQKSLKPIVPVSVRRRQSSSEFAAATTPFATIYEACGNSDVVAEDAAGNELRATGEHSATAECMSSDLTSTLSACESKLLIAFSLPPVYLAIHGGGFVGSSFSNDVVLLGSWAAAAASPFMIVFPHYSLAPAARYPTALNELLQVYMWLRRRSPVVAVGGDSAGGNLTCALTLRCISDGLPTPSALVLIYPALNLNPSPSPSRALHMNDPLVPVSLLQELARAYIPQNQFGKPGANTDPCLHPALASDDDLRLFPPTSIMCGGLDPLLDDAIDFSTRLRRLGVAGELQVLRELPHGFLNFQHLPGVSTAVETLRTWVMQALNV